VTTYLDRLLELVASKNFSVAPQETLETLERVHRHNIATMLTQKRLFQVFKVLFRATQKNSAAGPARPKTAKQHNRCANRPGARWI
jgi:hypothetical protein